MEHKIKHYLYVPFSGLGLYNGFRGNRWLRNRIAVFKQFVIPSLQAQTEKNFTVWVGWRPEERENKYVKELQEWMKGTGLNFIFTFGGLCFWDDKYPDDMAKSRLATNLHLSLRDLIDDIGDVDSVLMTIQPSDDCYRKDAVEIAQKSLTIEGLQAFGWSKGYIMNYMTGELAEYNPTTNPPFYTIKFPKEIFIEPQKHISYAPIKSHEYVANHLRYGVLDERGFLVGCHMDNVSTFYNHPFKGEIVDKETLAKFGLEDAGSLDVPFSLRRLFFSKLPHQVKRKLRYWAGEKRWIFRPLFSVVYNFLRG